MTRQKNGYSLVLIILLTTVIMAVLGAALRVVTQSYIFSREEYYYKLGQEAGEAGAAYANACLDKNSVTQTWGSAAGGVGPLVPSSDCKGVSTAFASNKYVYEGDTVRTSFEVGDLEVSTSHHAQVSSKGFVEVLNNGAIIKTYTVIVKKSITWPSDLVARKVVSGTYRTCAIMSNSVWCWGKNRFGQLGNGKSIGSQGYAPGVAPDTAAPEVDSLVPVRVRKDNIPADAVIEKIFTAQFHTCILASGKVYCWGWNRWGQLGNGEMGVDVHSSVPVQVRGVLEGKTVTDIGGASDTSCAIADGKVYCWGYDLYGMLGANSVGKHQTLPQQVTATGGTGLPTNYVATSLSTGGSRSYNMCAIISVGSVYCWGRNHAGQLGLGTAGGSLYAKVPTRVPGLSGVTDVSLDGFFYGSAVGEGWATHVCAIASGKVYCWGGSGLGQVGSSLGSAYIATPKLVENIPPAAGSGPVKRVQVGIAHSCMLSSNNKVYCWGRNHNGQLGANNKTVKFSVKPMAVYVGNGGIPSDQTVLDISSGSNRGCAIVSNGRSYCWGYNSDGQIGDGTTTDRFSPTESLYLRPTQNRFIY